MDAVEERSILERVLAFARAVEGFARRTAGAFLTLAVAGLGASLWLAVYLRQLAAWPAFLSFPVSLLLVAPPVLLLRLSLALRDTVGLPERILQSAAQLHVGVGDLRRAKDREGEVRLKRVRLGQFLRAGRAIWSLRKAGGEARELVMALGGAVVIWNPFFPILLGVSTVLSMSVVLLGLLMVGIWVL